jgi:GT2 family glycosyltransferase
MPQPDVSLIIISLNSLHYLKGCLQSIRDATWKQTTYEVIIVDNGSKDGTLEYLQREWPSVLVVANEKNRGFCQAGNQGAHAAAGRYLLFLNDDILILDDALPKLVEFMDQNPNAGMVGSRLLNLDGTDQFSSGRTFPSPMNALFGRKSILTKLFPRARWARGYLLSDLIQSAAPYEVDWLSAAAMLVRASIFQEIGGLAEDFYYFHEMIICARSKRAGHSIFLHPLSRIIHYEGAGSGVRTRRVRLRHVKGFHLAAYRWFCLHHTIGRYNPVRILIAGVLAARALALMAIESLRSDSAENLRQAQAGRPEGGVAL